MIKYLSLKTISGIIFGSVLGLVFILIVGVRAVDPGTIVNPTFGPNDHNVDIQVQEIACTWNGWYCSVLGCGADIGNSVDGHYHMSDFFCDGEFVTEVRYLGLGIA